MESIKRMKGRIEDLQEQDFEMYKSDIADTIALRLWQKHQGDIDAIVANEKLEIESVNKIDSICFVDGSRISMGSEPHIEPGWVRKGDRYPARLLLSAA
ncbi:MAG: hypothetical protein F4Y39_08575 [Gemmatimonadetes bacterium]|nr:hypothetical protein [Gemmatimonadota bacterium]MYK51700.1 hypothetical protein [Gemmatimonadota bacterium]